MAQHFFYFHRYCLSAIHVGLLIPTWPLNVKILKIPSSSHATLSIMDTSCPWLYSPPRHQWLTSTCLFGISHQLPQMHIKLYICKAQFMFSASHNHFTTHLAWWPSNVWQTTSGDKPDTCFNTPLSPAPNLSLSHSNFSFWISHFWLLVFYLHCHHHSPSYYYLSLQQLQCLLCLFSVVKWQVTTNWMSSNNTNLFTVLSIKSPAHNSHTYILCLGIKRLKPRYQIG